MAFSFDLAVIFLKSRRSKGIRTKRRETCKSHKPTCEIVPFDLVIDILTRLPAKSLMRFKSVSKLWSSSICSQYFIKPFLKVSSPRIYMWLGLDNNIVLLLSSSSSLDSDGTISSFGIDQDLTIPAMEGYSISQVFHGLMCFVNGPSAQIYSTSTRQLVLLPEIEESNIIAEDHKRKKITYHIGHDPIHDQYKVVCTVSRRDEVGKFLTHVSEHWVFLLGRDRSSRWRSISSSCPPHVPLTQGLTINGCMYYLAWVRVFCPVLVSINISSEELSLLQGPEDAFLSHYYTDVIEYGGRVAFLNHSDLEENGELELWVMESVVKHKWSKKTLVLHSSQMDMVKMHIVKGMSLKVQGTTRNGEVIFVPQNTSRTRTRDIIVEPHNITHFYIFLYNIQDNHLRKVQIEEPSNHYLTKLWDVIGLDDTDNLMYL